MVRSKYRDYDVSPPSPPEEQQGMFADFVDSAQRGFFQATAGMFETVDQVTGVGGGLRDWSNDMADAQIEQMSQQGQDSLTQEVFTEDEQGRLTLGEGATSARTWLNLLGQGAGTVAGTLTGGGAVGGGLKLGARAVLTATGRKALEKEALQQAGKAGFKGKAKSIVANSALSISVGNGMVANGEREKYAAMSFDELSNSPAFSDEYWTLRDDPANANVSSEELGEIARAAMADKAADRAFQDPKLTAANAIGGLAGVLGGRSFGLVDDVFKPATTVKGGVGKGFLVEGAQETGQGGMEALVSNEIYRDLVDPDFDVTQGVAASALNEGVIGGALGATSGGIGGAMSRRKAQDVDESAELADQDLVQEAELAPEPAPVTGNSTLDGELGSLDTSLAATEQALEGAKQRRTDNERDAANRARRSALVENGILPERNQQQNTLDLARSYDSERYEQIANDLSNPLIDENPEYAQELESELLQMAQQASSLGIDPLATAVDQRTQGNRRTLTPEQKLGQRLNRYEEAGVIPDAVLAHDQVRHPEDYQTDQQRRDLVNQKASEARDSRLSLNTGPFGNRQLPDGWGQREDTQAEIENDAWATAEQERFNQAQREEDFDKALAQQEQIESLDARRNQLAGGQSRLSGLVDAETEMTSASRAEEQRHGAKQRELERTFNPIKLGSSGVSKRLRRKMRKAKGFDGDAVLDELQHAEKRLKAYILSGEQVDSAAADLQEHFNGEAQPVDTATEQAAIERMSAPEAEAFKENLITQTMNNLSDVVDNSQGTVLEIDGKETSLPEVKRQLSNSVRALANKYIGKTAVMNESLRQQREANQSAQPKTASALELGRQGLLPPEQQEAYNNAVDAVQNSGVKNVDMTEQPTTAGLPELKPEYQPKTDAFIAGAGLTESEANLARKVLNKTNYGDPTPRATKLQLLIDRGWEPKLRKSNASGDVYNLHKNGAWRNVKLNRTERRFAEWLVDQRNLENEQSAITLPVAKLTDEQIANEVDSLVQKDEQAFIDSGLDSRFRQNMQYLSEEETSRLHDLKQEAMKRDTNTPEAARQRNLERVDARNKAKQSNNSELPNSSESSDIEGVEKFEHTTKRGKKLEGYIVPSSRMSKEQAQAIDKYTFPKAGGWFVRSKHKAELENALGALDQQSDRNSDQNATPSDATHKHSLGTIQLFYKKNERGRWLTWAKGEWVPAMVNTVNTQPDGTPYGFEQIGDQASDQTKAQPEQEAETVAPIEPETPNLSDSAKSRTVKVSLHGVDIEVQGVTKGAEDNYNRATHVSSGRNFLAEHTAAAKDIIEDLEAKGLLDTPERKAKAKELVESHISKLVEFTNWESNHASRNPSTFVTGRGGRSQKSIDRQNASSNRHMDEYTQRVDKLTRQRNSIAERVELVRNEAQQEAASKKAQEQAYKKLERTILDSITTVIVESEKGASLGSDAKRWANPKALKAFDELYATSPERAKAFINKLDGEKTAQDLGGIIKIVGSRTNFAKRLNELGLPSEADVKTVNPTETLAGSESELGSTGSDLVDAFASASSEYEANPSYRFKVDTLEKARNAISKAMEEAGATTHDLYSFGQLADSQYKADRDRAIDLANEYLQQEPKAEPKVEPKAEAQAKPKPKAEQDYSQSSDPDVQALGRFSQSEADSIISHIEQMAEKMRAIAFNWKKGDPLVGQSPKALYNESNSRQFELMISKAETPSEFQKYVNTVTAQGGSTGTLFDIMTKLNSRQMKKLFGIKTNADIKEHVDNLAEMLEDLALKLSAPQPKVNQATSKQRSSNDQANKIDDFGETLHGARKHNWGAFGDAVSKDMTRDEMAGEPLSKLFPKPNYQKLKEAGVSNINLAMIAVMRGTIPTKPRARYRRASLAKWVDTVEAARKLTQLAMNNDPRLADAPFHKNTMGQVLNLIADKLTVEQIETLGNFEAGYYNITKKFAFKRKKAYGRDSVEANSIEELGEKVVKLFEGMESGKETTSTAIKSRADLGVYTRRFTGEAIIGLKVGSRVIDIKTGFESTKEARAYLTDNRTALEDEVIAKRKEMRKQVRSDSNRDREGMVEREGNVTPEDFSKAFGFRGVQFGNWVEGKRRQQDLNNAYDSLMDLAKLMGVSPRAIALNGKLGLAFGARGKGGQNAAAAHFEPGTFVINLTKKSGQGSLAHEWFHALDYHFGKGTAVSRRNTAKGVDGIRPEMAEYWDNIKKAIASTDLEKRSKERDEFRSKPYWSTQVEMFARSFESWVIEQNSHNGVTNDYLANVLPDDNSSDYPYPTQAEMDNGLSQAYSQFADALQEQSDGDNINLYSLDADKVVSSNESATKQDVEGFVSDVFEGSPDIAFAQTQVKVVQSETDLPSRMVEQIERDGAEGRVKGLYDPETDQVYIVADKVQTKELAERVIFHELVGHHGLRRLFGDSLNTELVSIRSMLGGKSGVLKLARKMGVDLGSYVDVTDRAVSNGEISASDADTILLEELIAHVAEKKAVSGPIDRLLNKVKNWLRRHGFGELVGYGKSDLLELMTNIRTSFDTPPPNGGGKKGRSLYSLDGKRRATDFAKKAAGDSAPTAQVNGSLPDIDSVLATKQSDLVTRIKAAIKGFSPIEAIGRNKYAMLTLGQVGEVASLINKDLGLMIYGYQKEVDAMVATQNTLAEEAANVSEGLTKWAKKNAKAADQMFKFAHEATLADVDPSVEFIDRADDIKLEIARLERAYKEYGGSGSERGIEIAKELKEMRDMLKQEPFRRREHERLRPVWERMSKDQKAKFREMRDYYIKQGERFDKALEENINRAVEDQKIRKEMIAKLRQRQELRAKGLYFPLSRFGDYWVDFADKDGQRQFMMFESKAEMEATRDKLRDAGFDVSSGMKAKASDAQSVPLPFVADVMNLVRGSKMNKHNADMLSDQIYQMYLRTLPGRSLRRNFIHRKGVEGFSQDAIRVLADNGFKQSRQQARLDHMDVLDNHLVAIQKHAETSEDNAEISRITEELGKRHEWVRNPSRSAWAQKLTSLGFVWLLGATPAAALVNLTQNLQVALPILSSRYGMAESSGEMAKASKEFMGAAMAAFKDKGRERGHGILGNQLKGLEKEAFRKAVLQGAIDTTQAADLAGLAENPNAKYSGKWNKAMNMVGWAFHNAEVFNREVTFITAYRLAMKKTGDHEASIEAAIKDTQDSHFDYSSTNRARFMQSDGAAVALQFKQYSQNMTFYLSMNLFNSLKGESPEVKAAARKQLLGTLAVTFGIGGLGALPLWALTGVLNAANDVVGDDDEPWDAETELKAMLGEAFGKEAAAMLWYGAVPSISGRISLNDLWVRSIDRDVDADKAYIEYMKQALGPVVGGIGVSFARGISDIGDDFGMRSAEAMLPKAARDVLKASRYMFEEGVYTRNGYEVIGDMSALEIAAQGIGFSVGRANIQYDENSAIKNYELHVSKRRSRLMSSYYTAHRLGDKSAMNEVMNKIESFNSSRYGKLNPIKQSSLNRAINSRRRNIENSVSGLKVGKKYQQIVEDYDLFD